MTRRLTQKQESLAHVYALAGVLAKDYKLARHLVELESLGRALRSRFEGICSYPSCNEPPYLARTEKMVERAKELIAILNAGTSKAISNYEINRDPRGPAIKLVMSDMGNREFYL